MKQITPEQLSKLEFWRDEDGLLAAGKADDYVSVASVVVQGMKNADEEKVIDMLADAMNCTYGISIHPKFVKRLYKALEAVAIDYMRSKKRDGFKDPVVQFKIKMSTMQTVHELLDEIVKEA